MCYDGTDFCGWQVQPDAPSVQGALESALGVLLKEKVQVTGAGRTDTGVHASAYVAHFDFLSELDCAQLRYKLNAILPDGVAIKSISPAADEFHARFGATRREYKYFLHREKDPFADKYSYLCGYPVLDFEAMNKAAAMLTGTHDFSCFEKSGGDNRTSICTVYEAGWHKTDETHWYFRISADRFLRNMVRAIVGTLIEVGRGKRSPESVADLVLPPEPVKSAVSKRSAAGESVPGNALFLTAVEYL